jgi:aspartate racemase
MTVVEFISSLHKSDIILTLDNGKIKCSAPKGVLTPDIAEQIKQRKSELIDFLNEALTASASLESPIVQQDFHGQQPLSIAQTSLWYVNQMMPTQLGYNLPSAFKLSGKLNITLLEKCFTEFITRHEIMRARYISLNGEPVQIIDPPYQVKFDITDLSQSTDINNDLINGILKKEAKFNFNLEKPPLYKIKVIKISDNEHLMLWMPHHMIWDGWSFDLFLEEITTLYNDFSKNNPPSLPLLPIQYADYAAWQKERLKDKDITKQIEYWQKQLSGDIQQLQMPRDKGKQTSHTAEGGRIRQDFSIELANALKTLGNEEGATIFMVLLSAYYAILYRYTEQEDICIGNPMWGRVRPETEKIIGFFTNTVVLRTRFNGNMSFRELLRSVKKTCIDAFANQSVPLETILEKTPDIIKGSLYQALFSYQDARSRKLQMDNIKITQIPEPQAGIPAFDILIWFKEDYNMLLGRLDFNNEIFSYESMQILMQHLGFLLESAVKQPDCSISALSIISGTERNLVINEWSGAEKTSPENFDIIDLFYKQAISNPTKVALRTKTKNISYVDLNNFSDKIANYFFQSDVNTSSSVGICLTRSINTVAVILGLYKYGVSFVMLDPTDPLSQLSRKCSIANISLIVTDDASEKLICNLKSSKINLNDLINDSKKLSVNCSSFKDFKSDRIISKYFSIAPNGEEYAAVVSCVSFTNSVYNIKEQLKININDRIISFAPETQLEYISSIFLSLCSGAETFITDKNSLDGNSIINSMENQNISVAFGYNEKWKAMLDAGWIKKGILKIINYGEFLSEPLTNSLLEKKTEIYNVYGYAEAAALSCIHNIDNIDESTLIGKPITNTKMYILDKRLQPVPIGAFGQLYISCTGINNTSRYYTNSDKFIQCPFSKEKGALLFATGDIVRFTYKGTVEYHKRIDSQVFIDGFRVMPSEVENILSKHETIQNSCIINTNQLTDKIQLIAFIIPKPDKSIDVKELEKYLTNNLPKVKLPAIFEILDSFPLYQNGKIKKAELLEQYITKSRVCTATLIPKTDNEIVIADLWGKLLGKTNICITDNFFQLGGHSLLAVQLFHQIQEKTGKNLPLATLFSAPTLKDLAALVSEEKGTDEQKNTTNKNFRSLNYVVPIKPSGDKYPFFAIHGVGGNVLNYNLFLKFIDDDQPLYGIQCRGLDGSAKLFGNVYEMAIEYVKEIKQVQPHGPYFLGGGSMGGLVAYEVAQQLKKNGESIGLILMLDSICPKGFNKYTKKHVLKTHSSDSLTNSSSSVKSRTLLQKVTHSIKCRVIDASRNLKCKFYEIKNQPIPHKLRYWRIEQKNLHLARIYDPQPYYGDITIFRANQHTDNWDPNRGWKEYIKGKIHFQDFDSNHESMIESEDVEKGVGQFLKKTMTLNL